jgi:NAD(P)-dependent dehydrogenase (short-subunit alcohol dehydrogenase family)
MSTVLITGANRGLGLEFAQQFAAAGASVLGACREPQLAAALAQISGIEVCGLDVGSAASVAALAATLKGRPIDILINNAGRLSAGRAEHNDPEAVLEMFRINTLGPLMLSEALIDNLAASTRRLIVTVSSDLGSLSGNASGGNLGYRVSKAAVNMVMRTLAVELKPRNIGCVLLTPGWVRTDMGGANAPLSPTQSVTGMYRVIERLGPRDTGRWLDHSGQECHW